MRSLKTIQKLSSLGSILSKIAFILSVVGFCGCIAGLIGLRCGSDAVLKLGDIRLHGLIANEYGRAAGCGRKSVWRSSSRSAFPIC